MIGSWDHRKRWLFSATWALLTCAAGLLYFAQNGMYRTIVPNSAAYLQTAWQGLRTPQGEADRFQLDLGQSYALPSDYGGGPIGQDADGRYVAVTAPALRITAPRMRRQGQYDITASLTVSLPRSGRLIMRVGDTLQRSFPVRGDGGVERLSWRVPAWALSGASRPVRLTPDWPPIASIATPEGRQGVWFYLRGLTIEPAGAR
jgi:hypothetical protein